MSILKAKCHIVEMSIRRNAFRRNDVHPLWTGYCWISSALYFMHNVLASWVSTFWNMQSVVPTSVMPYQNCLKWAASWQKQQSECAPSEDSDQPGHPPSPVRMPRLIWVFAGRTLTLLVLSWGGSNSTSCSSLDGRERTGWLGSAWRVFPVSRHDTLFRQHRKSDSWSFFVAIRPCHVYMYDWKWHANHIQANTHRHTQLCLCKICHNKRSHIRFKAYNWNMPM